MVSIEMAKRAITGDEEAIVALLKVNEDKLYRIAFAYLRNEQDAIEAIQELTYRTFKKIHTVKNPAFIHTWLVRILINICLDMKKKQVKLIYKESIEISYDPDDKQLEMANLIEQLPIEQQELIYLKYFQDLKNDEIAKIKNIPEGTVKSRLHATLKRLRKLIGKEEM
ncbi:sigma-70 family RNA polymerase sigma factor [Rummeliibacillus pycnus]|uniref:sigma-70 family RNA polymerase sigma factor n=1 Tax=Rummeliibacillus pycnus TaxID=101070 RepID=UPI001FE269ED|nr:sigma-70 family RNA polymerase sigma factor [Rummeliibacillus pycnus]